MAAAEEGGGSIVAPVPLWDQLIFALFQTGLFLQHRQEGSSHLPSLSSTMRGTNYQRGPSSRRGCPGCCTSFAEAQLTCRRAVEDGLCKLPEQCPDNCLIAQVACG